ncbi:ComF family protein [Bacillus sp. T33-2]|uniref:ComF family protein n=1 Tax=Bacillus sp. T33-2 TaxID=2054168 RepID=UPI000C78F035|nr:ComF family protein [Bacillus sp. T33-2]PLR90804.1 amidophosphoribosyltransferase [Bacillus sp. T33-2]
MRLFESEFCLFCHAELEPETTWHSLFWKVEEESVCPACRGKMIKIEGETCQICSRPFNTVDVSYQDGEVCLDCRRWEEDPDWSGCLSQNISLYVYNDFLKEIIARYKFRGDYILARGFSGDIKKVLSKFSIDFLVPIPLSSERQYERGFNQAEALILEAGIQPAHLLTRLHTEKQSKKSRSERIHLPQVFQIGKDAAAVAGKIVLLIDDIYTTGSTLRHAAKVLKDAGATKILSLTLAR